jgi:hypothetical protein
MIEGSGSGSTLPLTNGPGSGSRNTGTYATKSAQNDTNAAIHWELSSYYIILTALPVLATSLPMLPIYKFSGMFGLEPRVLP